MSKAYNSNLKKSIFPNPYIRSLKRKNSDPAVSISKSLNSKSKQEMIGQFIIGKTLGKGTFGKVKLGIHSITGEKVKLLDEIDKARIDREIKILKSTFHHNLIRIYSVIETQNTIYLLTEYAEGGELFNYIVLKRKLTEYDACRYFHQLIDSIEYLHKIGICHRDLKPENMLLDHNKDLKLADFGLSNLYKNEDLLSTACGSPGYAAPEMIRGEKYNGLLSDIWSCGIILFVMVCGYLPFDDKNEDELYNKILAGKYQFPAGISSNVTDLISKILLTNPKKRIGLSDIRSHPWYHLRSMPKIDGLFISVHSIPIDYSVIEVMKQYGFEKEEIKSMLLKNKHNNVTTLYYLLIKKNLKKGIPSISDMVSKQFQQFIKEKNRVIPEYLILTKVDSSIIQQESNKSIGRRISNRNKNKQASNYMFQNNSKVEDDSNNTVSFNQCETELNEYNTNKCNLQNNPDIQQIINKTGQTLENIKEQNEFENQFIIRCPRIPRFKASRAINNKIKTNEPALTKQLRTQYNKYIKNAWAKKKTGFKRGFLQTSMSFHKNENKQNNNTFTIDDDTPTNNQTSNINIINSRDNSAKRIIENFYSNKPLNRKHFQSQPKQRPESSLNYKTNLLNDKTTPSNMIEILKKKMNHPRTHINNSFQIPKELTNQCINTSTNVHNTSVNKPQNYAIKNYKYFNQKKRSNEHKSIDLGIFSTLKNSIKKHKKNNKSVITQHNAHLQNNSYSIKMKPKNYSKAYRAISERKDRDSIKGGKYHTHSNSISLTQRNKNTNDLSSTLASQRRNQFGYSLRKPKEISITPINKTSKKTNRPGGVDKYTNFIQNIQNNKRFGKIGKQTPVKLGLTKGNANKLKFDFNHNKIHSLKQKSEGEKSCKNRSSSTCSTISNKVLPLYNGTYDHDWTSSKSISTLKDNIARILPTNQISVTQTNSNNKYICRKNSLKFTVELYQIKDQKKLIFINVSLVDGMESDLASIKQIMQLIFNN